MQIRANSNTDATNGQMLIQIWDKQHSISNNGN